MNAFSSGGILDWVWQTMWINSISTAILVPVVLLLCRIFDRRPAVQNLLWLLLLVKFMTPQIPGFAWVIPKSVVGSQWNQNSPLQQDQVKLGEETDWISPERVPEPIRSMTINDAMIHEQPVGNAAIAPEPTIVVSPSHVVSVTLGSVWILGAGYFLVSIGYGLSNQGKILNRATDAGQSLLKTVSEVATQLGLRKLVSIQSSDIQSPFISCLGSVRLVWPTCLTTSDPSLHRSLIAHEAAHVRRLDHFVAWLELIATLVWWWNPLFWLVRRRLRTSAEMACDTMALEAFPEDRCLYAEKLLELSTCFKNGSPPLALAVGGDAPSSFERRLTMIVSERGSSKTTLLGLLIVSMFAIAAIPSWVFAQNAANPPAPEPISWLLDPFMRRVPPPPQQTANQQGVTTAPPVLNKAERLVLRLKALYLVAISENRTTDAEALAAAISAMTQVKAAEHGTPSVATPGALGTGPVVPGMGGRGMMGSGGPVESVSPGTGLGGAPAGIGGMPDSNVRESIDLWSTVYRHANGNFDVPNLIYPKEVIRDHLPLRIKVTGNNHGMVWGSNPYTDDSSLNAAAIHAGLVRDGQTAELVFIRRPGKDSYSRSQSHGVTTHENGPWAGSFELASASQYPDASYLCDRSALRGNADDYLTLNMLAGQAPLKPGVSLIVPLNGSAGAPIAGTDDYASDCNLDAAAVHAGVLQLGESGYVKIILAEGLENYAGSKRNGVDSFPYGKTKLSLRFEKVPTARSGDPLPSPTSSGGATGGLGEPTGDVPGGTGTPVEVLNPVGGRPGDSGPPVRVGEASRLDRREYLGRDPGPRRGWHVEPQAGGEAPLLSQMQLPSGNDISRDSQPINQQEDGNYASGSLSERTEIIRELGPRVNWAVERYNLHRSLALGQFRSHLGIAVRIRVTGEKDGLVWGSNPYSDDSSLHSAALHSGLVKEGQTTDVVAIIRPGQKSYAGSESHGITANDFGSYPGSFELVPVSQCPDAPYLCDRYVLRNSTDNYLSLNKLAGQAQLKPGVRLIVPLHAKAGAPIVGTDQYASDNNLDATAIHAGVLKDGESGYVKLILDEGLDSYAGSKRNGVESYPYGKTKMSIRFEKLSAQPNNSLPASSLNNQRLRAVDLITDGLGTAFVDVDILSAIEATSEAKKTEPSIGSPGIPNEPPSTEQQLSLPESTDGVRSAPNGNVLPNIAPPNNTQPQSSSTKILPGRQPRLTLRVSSKNGEISSIAIGPQKWTTTEDALKDLDRLKSLLAASLRDTPCELIEIHLDENVFFDRAKKILDVCSSLRTEVGHPISTIVIDSSSRTYENDDSSPPTDNAPEIILQKGTSESESSKPVQIGFEDGK